MLIKDSLQFSFGLRLDLAQYLVAIDLKIDQKSLILFLPQIGVFLSYWRYVVLYLARHCRERRGSALWRSGGLEMQTVSEGRSVAGREA
jgi:hypothetical protein